MDNVERIKRIKEMENRLNKIIAWLNGQSYDSIDEDACLLDEYYKSELWKRDFEADERGELPSDLQRGVLSEDAVYNALMEYKETGTWTGLWEMPGGIQIPAQNASYENIAIITCEMDETCLIEKYCYYNQNGFGKAYPIISRSRVVTKNEEADK